MHVVFPLTQGHLSNKDRFLALLDSVSRAHGMGLQHVVRLASAVWRPSSPFTIGGTVISEPIKCISFKFQF